MCGHLNPNLAYRYTVDFGCESFLPGQMLWVDSYCSIRFDESGRSKNQEAQYCAAGS